jgi:N-acetylneuraminic acid mutarotase
LCIFEEVFSNDQWLLAAGRMPENGTEEELKWTTLATRLQMARHTHAASVHDNMLYVTAGEGNIEFTETFHLLDNGHLVTNPTTITSPISARDYAANASSNGCMHIIGGFEPQGVNATSSTAVFDFATEEWSVTQAPLAGPRYGHSATVHNGVVYVMGGMGPVPNALGDGGWVEQQNRAEEVEEVEEVVLSTIEVYDTAAEDAAWRTLESEMPENVGRYDHSTSVHKGSIILTGGSNDQLRGNTELMRAYAYNISTKEWARLPADPSIVERTAHTTTVHNGKLYVVGGFRCEVEPHTAHPCAALQSVDVFDFASAKWSSLPHHLNHGRAYHATVVHANNLYVIGGTEDRIGIPLGSIEAFPLPFPYQWQPHMHHTYPPKFKAVVWLVLLCAVRADALVDDILFLILSLLNRTAFGIDFG